MKIGKGAREASREGFRVGVSYVLICIKNQNKINRWLLLNQSPGMKRRNSNKKLGNVRYCCIGAPRHVRWMRRESWFNFLCLIHVSSTRTTTSPAAARYSNLQSLLSLQQAMLIYLCPFTIHVNHGCTNITQANKQVLYDCTRGY
jgi:hypothetical protein